VLSIAASALMMLTVVGSGEGIWPWGVVPMITQVLVIGVLAFVATGSVATITLIGSIAASAAIAAAANPERAIGSSWSNVMLFSGIAIMAGALGAVLRQATDIGVDLRREREKSAEAQAQRLVVEEKSRVARELHDVIAHNMSLITVQARSAPHRLPRLAPEASEEFSQIAARAADALAQMRGVLTVLRTEPGQSGLSPAPSVRQVPELVASVREAGQDVELSWQVPEETAVGDDVGTSAYRIIQEALSNVRRHAPTTTADLSVRVEGDELVARIDNPLPERSLGEPTVAGHGLVGMRERAAAVSGRITVGESEPGHFTVEARLPLRRRQPTG
jgi:signal transduction histidine kinase